MVGPLGKETVLLLYETYLFGDRFEVFTVIIAVEKLMRSDQLANK